VASLNWAQNRAATLEVYLLRTESELNVKVNENSKLFEEPAFRSTDVAEAIIPHTTVCKHT